jgi:aryl-alcohol dehydrogenase-like predicted oxidoreductase
VITGATSMKQLQENLDSAETVEKLSDDVLEKIEQILGNYPEEE